MRRYAETLPNGSSIWRREYFAEDVSGTDLPQPDFEKGGRFIDGTIKWDGCAHLNFGDEDGYIHVCGEDTAAAVRFVLASVFDLARIHVRAYDPLPFDWSKS